MYAVMQCIVLTPVDIYWLGYLLIHNSFLLFDSSLAVFVNFFSYGSSTARYSPPNIDLIQSKRGREMPAIRDSPDGHSSGIYPRAFNCPIQYSRYIPEILIVLYFRIFWFSQVAVRLIKQFTAFFKQFRKLPLSSGPYSFLTFLLKLSELSCFNPFIFLLSIYSSFNFFIPSVPFGWCLQWRDSKKYKEVWTRYIISCQSTFL